MNDTTTPAIVPETLEERVARLRTAFLSSQRGQSTVVELTPPTMVRLDPDIVDFTAWQQWSQWTQY